MDGRSKQYKAYIQSARWELKRQETFKLFGRKCQKCKSPHDLHIHHKTYARFQNENVSTDLVPLCRSCHKALHRFVKRRGLDLYRGSTEFLYPPKPNRQLAQRLQSMLRIPALMKVHGLREADVRALIDVGAL